MEQRVLLKLLDRVRFPVRSYQGLKNGATGVAFPAVMDGSEGKLVTSGDWRPRIARDATKSAQASMVIFLLIFSDKMNIKKVKFNHP